MGRRARLSRLHLRVNLAPCLVSSQGQGRHLSSPPILPGATRAPPVRRDCRPAVHLRASDRARRPCVAASAPAGTGTGPDRMLHRARAYFEEFAAGYDEAADDVGMAAQRSPGRVAGRGGCSGRPPSTWPAARGPPWPSCVGCSRWRPWSGSTSPRPWWTVAAARVPDARRCVRADLCAFVDGRRRAVRRGDGDRGIRVHPGPARPAARWSAAWSDPVATSSSPTSRCSIGWPPQSPTAARPTSGSNGLELTTFRWEPGEVAAGIRRLGPGRAVSC